MILVDAVPGTECVPALVEGKVALCPRPLLSEFFMSECYRQYPCLVSAFKKFALAPGCLALCLAIFAAGGAQAATWNFAPELRRLDAEGNELPAGQVDVAREQGLRVGLYITVTTDGTSPVNDSHLGFESFSGAIHFFSEELELDDIAPVVRSLRGGHGWQRRMENASFDPNADSWLGPPEETDNEASWIAFWSDSTNNRDNLRGAWCAGEGGTCSIFVGVLTIWIADLPTDAVGNLSLRFGGVTRPEESASVVSIFGRADESVAIGNTITYNLCPVSGCAVLGDEPSDAPDRESRARAMQFALAGFGRTIGGNMVEMIGERSALLNAGYGGSYAAIGGRPVDLEALGFGNGEGSGLSSWVDGALELMGVNPNGQEGLAWEAVRATGLSSGNLNRNLLPNARDLLTGSSFEVALGGDDDGAPGAWTLWGVGGDMAAFGGQPDDNFSMDGEVFAGHLGLDYRLSETILAGVIVSRTKGDVDYRFSDSQGDDGDVEMMMTSAHPYLHWTPVQGLGVWGAVGVGRGAATLTDDKGEAETSIALRMTAIGARRELMPIGLFDFAVKADAFFVRMEADEHEHLPEVQADSSRMRLALEGSRSFQFEGGSLLTSTLELGALANGGDAETGAGAELGGGLAYMHPGGIDIQARGHMLLTHTESKFEEWGASLAVTFDSGPLGEGLFFVLSPTWGAPATGAQGIWETSRVTESILASESDRGMNMDTRVGYGMNLPNGKGLLNLFGELGKPDGAPAHLRVGTRLGRLNTDGTPVNFEVFVERMGARSGLEPAYGIVLNVRGGL